MRGLRLNPVARYLVLQDVAYFPHIHLRFTKISYGRCPGRSFGKHLLIIKQRDRMFFKSSKAYFKEKYISEQFLTSCLDRSQSNF